MNSSLNHRNLVRLKPELIQSIMRRIRGYGCYPDDKTTKYRTHAVNSPSKRHDFCPKARAKVGKSPIPGRLRLRRFNAFGKIHADGGLMLAGQTAPSLHFEVILVRIVIRIVNRMSYARSGKNALVTIAPIFMPAPEGSQWTISVFCVILAL
jgi:hypothetical protein